MEKEKINDTEISEGAGPSKPFYDFVNSNFLGISILISTIIVSGTLAFVFGGGVSARPQTAALAPTAPSAQGDQGGLLGELSVTPEVGDAPTLGDPNAPVTIVEFSDYECPFCSRFFDQTLARIKSEYVDTGKVKFVYKDFPIVSIHPQAQKAAESARCVREQLGDDGYWAMHDMLFEGQQQLGVTSFKQWARELGVNGVQFDSCLDSGKYAEAVGADADEGVALGVNGTPTLFINDVRVVGAVPFEQIAGVIERELENTN